MKFNYQARTKDGQTQSGVVEASSREAALSILQRYGVYVTFLEEEDVSSFILGRRIKIFERISRKDVVMFSRQLAIMSKSNVPLVEALSSLASQTKNQNFKEKIFAITEEIEGGVPLSQALARYPKIFSSFYVNMIKSGEASGKLSETLNYLADHSEREYEFYSKIIGALIYPAFVLLVFVVVLTLMIVFVIPQVTEVLGASGEELPLITKFVVGISDFFVAWWWLIFASLSVGVILTLRFSKTDQGQKFFDRLFLKLPLLGDFFKKIYLARIAENLTTLISGGLPIAQSLEITGEVVGNDVYKTIIARTRDGVRRGESISSLLLPHPEFFPPLFIQMVVVGERTGQLDSSLLNVVDFYQKEVERSLENLIGLLEPLMIIG
ncbi:type II secretion system F family protein, partial [Patescibacteria group bacterium]|nr:type II secretion system F family protein [Patescibacteria group bacterium]